MNLKKCECGFGDHWYCNGNGFISHEYNRGLSPTAQKQADRQPEAMVYDHSDGNHIEGFIYRQGQPNESKKLAYAKQEGNFFQKRRAALAEGIAWVTENIDAKPEEDLQLDIFSSEVAA